MIYERHELLSECLEKLGVDKEIAAEDACRIEHVISPESFEAVSYTHLFIKNDALSSVLIAYVRMKDNWHGSIERYMLNEDDHPVFELFYYGRFCGLPDSSGGCHIRYRYCKC